MSRSYRQLRDAMLSGLLRPGDRLEPSRELARTLSVSRMTVTIALRASDGRRLRKRPCRRRDVRDQGGGAAARGGQTGRA